MSKIYPWDYHSDLTEERLVILAGMIVDGRRAAVELFDENAGDTAWTLGVRAFEFVRIRILRSADSGEHPWLGIIDRTLQLIFKIGEVPVRIYKGDADEPTGRTLRQGHSELRQLSLLFGEEDEGGDLAYRFAIETDIDGSALAVKFVGLRGENAVLNWDVPLAGVSQTTGAVGRQATASVDLPAPSVEVRGAVVKKGDGNEG
jgi:hypothetical protein